MMALARARLRLYDQLERFFGWVEYRASVLRMRFTYCPDCGQNVYTGEPCQR